MRCRCQCVCYCDSRPFGYPYTRPRRYGLGRLLLDFALVMLTGGIWLIWILIRSIRSNTWY